MNRPYSSVNLVSTEVISGRVSTRSPESVQPSSTSRSGYSEMPPRRWNSTFWLTPAAILSAPFLSESSSAVAPT
ncbi:MAG: hypothetical protein QOG96_2479 [Pseudonocardiales bacterium]|nr:hypothetical protein [Pseudonocardiales bacterium]